MYCRFTPIPAQRRFTHQMIKHWKSFQVLQQIFAVSHRAEQLHLHRPQCIIATSVDSVPEDTDFYKTSILLAPSLTDVLKLGV